jgi:hypothetical protein
MVAVQCEAGDHPERAIERQHQPWTGGEPGIGR